jgi:hypothetical protein
VTSRHLITFCIIHRGPIVPKSSKRNNCAIVPVQVMHVGWACLASFGPDRESRPEPVLGYVPGALQLGSFSNFICIIAGSLLGFGFGFGFLFAIASTINNHVVVQNLCCLTIHATPFPTLCTAVRYQLCIVHLYCNIYNWGTSAWTASVSVDLLNKSISFVL